LPKRLEILRSVIHPWHQDQFGHMNVRHYAPIFDDASFHIWAKLDVTYAKMLESHGVHTVVAQTTTKFIKELVAGDMVVVYGTVARVGNKSVTFHLEMEHAETGNIHATYEAIEVFFDPKARKSAPMPQSMRAILEAIN